MAKIDVLAKVDADLACGHTHLAVQRLSSLVAADPGDLSLRARLAAVHRSTGNAAAAGRWGYLTEDVTDAEVAAFTKTCRTARHQLNALRMGRVALSTLGPLAADRYAGLRARAAAEPGNPLPEAPGDPGCLSERLGDIVAGVLFFGTLALVVALIVIGAVTVVTWLI